MKAESTIAKLISTAGEKAAYDNACKKLLANKAILAWIMKSCLAEYRDCSLEEIAECIEGEPQISQTAVHRDESPESQQIRGENTEDASINEGTVTYDIRFRALTPGTGERISLIINVEAQNDYYPGYPIVTRGIYYCCRLVSAQYGTEFINAEYQKVKKVYSIFICINPPGYRKNTINRYFIQEEKLVGDAEEKIERYDLLTAVIICIGDADDTKTTGILRLLEVLLSAERKADEKKQILQEEFEIKMTHELEQEVAQMCNLSDGVERKGIIKGLREGHESGLREGRESGLREGRESGLLEATCTALRNLMESMGIALEQAMEILKIPEKDRRKYILYMQKMSD